MNPVLSVMILTITVAGCAFILGYVITKMMFC